MNKKAVVNQADAFWQDLLQQFLLYHMEGLGNPYRMMMDRMWWDTSASRNRRVCDGTDEFCVTCTPHPSIPIPYDGRMKGVHMDILEDSTSVERALFAHAEKNKIPLYGILELLPLCNMNCDMCYVRMSREEVEAKGRLRTLDEWLDIARQMAKAGTLFVLLTGGEPLLYPEFRTLYQELRRLGMIVTINTNGTLIDEDWADFFRKNRPRRINITLYGASEETYRNLCHFPEGYERTMRGIRLLRERGVDVKINGSLAKGNMNDRMEIIARGEELDVPVRIDTYMYPSVRERSCPYNLQARMSPEEAGRAKVEALRREMGEELFAKYREKTLELAGHTPEGDPVPGEMTCRAGKSSYTINWQGEMRACVVLDEPSVPVAETGFSKAWEQVVQGTSRIRTSAACSACKLRKICNTCAAGAKAECGAYDAVPEYLCRYTRETIRCLESLDDTESVSHTRNQYQEESTLK